MKLMDLRIEITSREAQKTHNDANDERQFARILT